MSSLQRVMVNERFPARQIVMPVFLQPRDSRGKSGLCSVNQSFSKPLEFSKNSPRIRFECAQKRERGLQACLLLMCHAANSKQPPNAQGYGTGSCSFCCG
jgi:hypothetical protein